MTPTTPPVQTPAPPYLPALLLTLLSTLYLQALAAHLRPMLTGTPLETLHVHLQALPTLLAALTLETGRRGWDLCEFTLSCAPWSPYC